MPNPCNGSTVTKLNSDTLIKAVQIKRLFKFDNYYCLRVIIDLRNKYNDCFQN